MRFKVTLIVAENEIISTHFIIKYFNDDLVVIGSIFLLRGNTILKQNERKKIFGFWLLAHYTIFHANFTDKLNTWDHLHT